jgi:hypothetical protein
MIPKDIKSKFQSYPDLFIHKKGKNWTLISRSRNSWYRHTLYANFFLRNFRALNIRVNHCDTAFVAIFSIGSKPQDYELHPIQCWPWYTRWTITSIVPYFCTHLVYSLWFTHIITGWTSTLSVWNILHFVFIQIIDWNVCFSGKKMYWIKIHSLFSLKIWQKL